MFFQGAGEISNSIFQGNYANATGGEATAGNATNAANTSAPTDAYGGGAYFGGTGEISNSIFQGNYANATGGGATAGIATNNAPASALADAYGGGAYFGGTGAISNSIFQGNYANATGGEATAGIATNNVSAYASAVAYGGGAYFGGTGAISNSIFQGNYANATGGGATAGNAGFAPAFAPASTYGGGAYFGGTGAISNSFFQGNYVNATGGGATARDAANAYGYAYGGGAYLGGTGTISNSIFQGNSANVIGGTLAQGGTGLTRSWANTDAYAFGGAVAFHGTAGTNIISDSSFIGNSVTATANGQVDQDSTGKISPEALALGGAIFSRGDLDLTANAGNTVRIAGNTANGAASGIHFGRSNFDANIGYFGDSEATTTFNVTANGTIEMLDPVTAELYRNGGTTFAMNIDVGNSGSFLWGGQNVLDANGDSTVTFNSGTTTLLADFQLTTTDRSVDGYRTGSATDAYARSAGTNDLHVTLINGTTLDFDIGRQTDTAIFDFTQASGSSSFNVDATVNLTGSVDRRKLLSVNDTDYLIADGVSNADATTAVTNFNKDGVIQNVESLQNGTQWQVWATVNYDSPYESLMWQNRNTWAARNALEELTNNRLLISDEQFDLLTRNFNAATAEYGVSQMQAIFQLLDMVSNTAVYDYFDNYNTTQSSYTQRAQSRCCNRPRFWGGYLGEFGRMDRHGRTESYKTTTNGILLGADRRLGSRSTIGIYGSYLDEKTRYRSIHAGVDADGFQTGLLYRRSLANNWKLLLDAGYGHFENDGYRIMAPFVARSSFKQDALSTGFGFEKKISHQNSAWTPFLRGRYIYAKQTGLTERGNTGFESMVSSFDGNSFTTNLGAEWTRKGRSGCWNWETGFSAAWVHEYADTSFSSLGSYSALPGNVFQMVSSGNDRDRLELGTDLRIDFNRSRSAFLSYDYMVSSHTTAHAVSAGAAWLF